MGATVVRAGVDAIGAVAGLPWLLQLAMTAADNAPTANTAVARTAHVAAVFDPLLINVAPGEGGHETDAGAGNARE